ncbi:MAG: hypothetical protein ACKOW3_06375 [Hyphomicrobium sp.]
MKTKSAGKSDPMLGGLKACNSLAVICGDASDTGQATDGNL